MRRILSSLVFRARFSVGVWLLTRYVLPRPLCRLAFWLTRD